MEYQRLVSRTATALLIILNWEKDRPEPVTVEEFAARTGVPLEQAQDAMDEVLSRGLVDVVDEAEAKGK